MDLSIYVRELERQKDAFARIPNILPYQIIHETEKAGYLARQYISTNLYDRISTRPFLLFSEKKWIAFQLLTAISQAHDLNIFHGDIKTENLLVTSYNWIFLVDFGIKPAFLPEDNPSDFSYYFDSSGRRTCYLAPERFDDTLFTTANQLTPEMDIFSIGCTIAELFLEGTPLFTFSQLLRYRRNEYDPVLVLEKIDDDDIKEMIRHMIQINPSSRWSAKKYLDFWRGIIFHESYYSYLHSYIARTVRLSDNDVSQLHIYDPADADACIQTLWQDHLQIVEWIGSTKPFKVGDPVLPLSFEHFDKICECRDTNDAGQYILIVSLICSFLRNIIYPHNKLKGLDLILFFGSKIEDEQILDRLIPYSMCFLNDENAVVRSMSLKVISRLVNMVNQITSADSNIFLEYIFPSVKGMSLDPEIIVRVSFVECLIYLAEISIRFLELSQILRMNASSSDNNNKLHINTYDASLRDLRETVKDELMHLLHDPDSSVKISLLNEISRFCVFFGRQATHDIILSHIITYLNDPNWELRLALFENIVGISTFLGSKGLEEFLLPLIIQSLTDSEEFVVCEVLKSLISLTELKLIDKYNLREIIFIALPLLCHPNPWIRNETIRFVACAKKIILNVDFNFIIYPMLRPFLRIDIDEITEEILTESLKSPLSRYIFDQAMRFAAENSDRLYRTSSFRDIESSGNDTILRENNLIQKLRNDGMLDDDREKIFALKSFISKSSKSKIRILSYTKDLGVEVTAGLLSLKDLEITPHTVFLYPPESNLNESNLSIPEQQNETNIHCEIESESSYSRTNTFPSEIQNIRKPLHLTSLARSPSSSQGSFGKRSWLFGLPSNHSNQSGFYTKGGSKSTIRNSRLTLSPAKVLNKEQFIYPSDLVNSGSIFSFLLNQKKKLLEFFPPPLTDLGDYCNPPSSNIKDSWTPIGRLVAHLEEHSAKINVVAISPDETFFITGSNDGIIKVWDSRRLVSNVVNKSRITYSELGGRISAIAFCENRNVFIATNDLGDIHICRVILQKQKQTSKLSGCTLIRKLVLDREFALHLDNFEIDSHSLLLIVTNRGKIRAIDLHTMKEVWSLQSPLHHGEITAFLANKRNYWIVTGTNRGVISLWDIRFRICLKSWSHPLNSWIHKISSHPKDPKYITIASSNEISVWDVSNRECNQVYCALKSNSKDANISEFVSKHYSNGFKAQQLPLSSDFMISFSKSIKESSNLLRTICINQTSQFIVASYYDCPLRLWNISTLSKSHVIGPSENREGARYVTQVFFGIQFHFEIMPLDAYSNTLVSNLPIWSKNYDAKSPKELNNDLERLESLSCEMHKDIVTAIQILRYPQNFIISAGRDGVLKIWK